MAFWHYPDGTPAPWGKGKFDWSHLQSLFLLAAIVSLLFLRRLLGETP